MTPSDMTLSTRSVVVTGMVRGVLAGRAVPTLWLRTCPELGPGFPVATWFGLSCALAFMPSLAMELGLAHLLLHLGSEEPANDSTKKP